MALSGDLCYKYPQVVSFIAFGPWFSRGEYGAQGEKRNAVLLGPCVLVWEKDIKSDHIVCMCGAAVTIVVHLSQSAWDHVQPSGNDKVSFR
jgi:hypothetical protein